MAAIVVENGKSKGRVLDLKGSSRFCLGRDAGCHLWFDDPLASRQHFIIELESEHFFIEDLRSRNGTYLNGHKVARESISCGDQIVAGDTCFSFLSDEESRIRGGLVGKTVAGCEILERLGRGGMGTVYLARQVSLSRQVAIKILSSHLTGNQTQVRRFLQEARSAGQLNHPNIVQVYDVGEADGLYYYSMEYLPGGNLEDLLNYTDRILPEPALAMMKDVARGLQYAESKKIVHRDIKPENLMLDEDGRVKIVDLGIALMLGDGSVRTKGVIGTPQYMAPEQAMSRPVDHRADIYALGCTFYRMLSGELPFTGSTAEEIMQKQIEVSARPLISFVPDMQESLSRLIERMMAKRPEDRPASATELLREIETCEGKSPCPAEPADEANETSPDQPDQIDQYLSARAHRKSALRRRALRRQHIHRILVGLVVSALILATLLVAAHRMLGAASPKARRSDRGRGSAGAVSPDAASLARAPASPGTPEPRPAGTPRPTAAPIRTPTETDGAPRGSDASAAIDAQWQTTLASTQQAIDAYQFGDAIRQLLDFQTRYPNAPLMATASRHITQVRQMARDSFLKYWSRIDTATAQRDWDAAEQLCQEIIRRWGLEPYVAQASTRLTEIRERRRQTTPEAQPAERPPLQAQRP